MRTSTVFLAALALAVGATPGAQAQTTTDCSAFGGTVSCRTQPNGFHTLGQALRARAQHNKAKALFADALQAGRCDEARALALQYGDGRDVEAVRLHCVTPEAAAERQDRAVMSEISALVKVGECERAKSAALNAGRLDLTDQVVRVCTPRQAGVAPPVEWPVLAEPTHRLAGGKNPAP